MSDNTVRRLSKLRAHMVSSAPQPLPFQLHVPDAVLIDLRRRLADTRWPDQLENFPANDSWAYGAELCYVRELAAYWEHGFDWRAAEASFNAIGPQFTLQVRGLRCHFVHQRCTGPAGAAAPALLLTHGWPGSVYEFHSVLPSLAAHFHVVAPSLAGYGFSEAPRQPGYSAAEAARSAHALMLALGYPRYGAQGGDWGAVVTRCLGVLFPEHCVAIHVNMPIAPMPFETHTDAQGKKTKRPFDMGLLTATERAGVARTSAFQKYGTGYQAIQKTRPQTLAYALTDSPVGLLAWMVEKFREWSDCSKGQGGTQGGSQGAHGHVEAGEAASSNRYNKPPSPTIEY